MAAPGRRLSRVEIVERNDAAIRDAVISMAAEVGWDAVTFSGVARRAGLTVGAVYGRVESSAELGIDLWEARVRSWFHDTMMAMHAAGRSGEGAAVAEALALWHRAPEMTAVTIDLLIASLFDADFDEVIGADARTILAGTCWPSGRAGGVTGHAAAAGALVSAFGLGHALALRGGAGDVHLTTQQLQAVAGLFSAAPSRRATPRGPELQWVRTMDDVDAGQRDVLRGTVDVLGRVGYRRATIARIAREAKVPRGSVMSHYSSKAELVGEAARLALIPPGEVWGQYAGVVSQHGPLTARAMFLQDFLKPENRFLWAVNLELARVGRYVPEVGQFRANANVLEHTHLGVMLLASFVPGLNELSFIGPFNAGTAT